MNDYEKILDKQISKKQRGNGYAVVHNEAYYDNKWKLFAIKKIIYFIDLWDDKEKPENQDKINNLLKELE